MRALFRSAASLRRQTYRPAHPAPLAPVELQGSGRLDGTWIACEEPGSGEGWLQSPIELIMDSRLEPQARIGRHDHPDTEEVYLVLEGTLSVTAWQPGGQQETATLGPGDVHRLGPGGWHSAAAGDRGARIIVVAAAVRP